MIDRRSPGSSTPVVTEFVTSTLRPTVVADAREET